MNDKRIFEDAFGEFKSNNRMTLAAYNHTIKALEKKEQLEQANKELLEINQQLGVEKEESEQQLAYECGCNSQLVDYQNAIEILKGKFELKFDEECKKVYLFTKEFNLHIYTFTAKTEEQINLLKEVFKNDNKN